MPEGTEPTAASATEPKTVEELPKWAQEHIRSVRDEAAASRVKATEAKAAGAAEATEALTAKLAEIEKDRDTFKGTAEQLDLQLTKYKTAVKVGVPGEQIETFAGLLQGGTAVEIETHATQVRALMGTSTPVAATDPTAGRSGTPAASPQDKLSAAFAARLPKR
jgi:hypothetical protein